jgi:hypothetical protein
MNENANPNGPNSTPRPNHRQPLAPLLEAVTAAAIPQMIHTRIAISMVQVRVYGIT